MVATAFTVNGKAVTVEAEPDTPLLWVLREHLKLTGTKFGCGIAQCGACTVHIDGEPTRSCSVLVSDLRGKQVTTIEGLSTDSSHPLQKAWIAEQVPPVRLLPVRPDHAGGGFAAKESQADPRRDHHPHGRQHLPLRHLSTHHRCHRKCEGGLTMLQDTRGETLSRRSFLVGTGAACVAVAFGSLPDTAAAAGPLTPNAWVTIGEDGIVTIVPPAVEMGQGAQTSLPLILAEELDADWSKVRLAPTPDNDKVYGNPAFRNQLTTVGSFAVTGYYEGLRLAGAPTRFCLPTRPRPGIRRRRSSSPSPASSCTPNPAARSATAIWPRPRECPIRCRR
jgi:hypothetical protein